MLVYDNLMMQFLLFLLSASVSHVVVLAIDFSYLHCDGIDFIIAVLGVVGDGGDRKTVKEMKA